MIRIDPLTGLKVIVADGSEPELDAQPELYSALPDASVVETLPGAPIGALSAAELSSTLETWRVRMRAYPDAAYVHVGADADRTRLCALHFVPAAIARERERFGAYATRTMGGNLLGDLVADEVRRRERVIAVDAEAVLFAPFAARVAYQLMIAPRRPRARFEDDGPLGAGLLHDALGRLRGVLESAPDVWVRTAPRGADRFCWRIDILPRAAATDAFERATGVPSCTLAPEQAAANLRAAAAT